MTAPHSIQVCFVGDSFVAGIGDESGLGWTGRLVARSAAAGEPITAYNLGIRRSTSAEILARCVEEVDRRRSPDRQTRVVISLGVNDATRENGEPRVVLAQSCKNLTQLLELFAGDPLLVVGPPAVADDAHNARIAELSARFKEICRSHNTPFIDVFSGLEHDPVWRQQVLVDDGAHPGAEGYQRIFELIFPAWGQWLSAAAGRH